MRFQEMLSQSHYFNPLYKLSCMAKSKGLSFENLDSWIFSNEALYFAARMVMTERKESGPIRPCHIRESFRRLKLEGKVPKRSVPRLFR
jgi:hypothetical protein